MKKIVSLLTTAALSLAMLSGTALAASAASAGSDALNTTLLADAATTVGINIGDIQGNAGDTVSVPVTISNVQPIAGMMLAFKLSSNLTLTAMDQGNAFRGSPTTNVKELVYVWYSSNGKNMTAADGSTILTLTVQIADTAPTGSYSISLIPAESQVRDQDGQDIAFSGLEGQIDVTGQTGTAALGDINADTHIDADDAVLALREYAKSMVGGTLLTDAQKAVADVNANSEIDADDAVLILQYYAKFMTNPDISWADILK